jgi:Sulfotransferase family
MWTSKTMETVYKTLGSIQLNDRVSANLIRHGASGVLYVDQPLVLISQLPRSGGTYLSQLFDGHPQIWPHPHELKIGFPDKSDWPSFSVSEGARRIFSRLSETATADYAFNPFYRKGSERHPILFAGGLKKIFSALFGAVNPQTSRDVLNIYFTSYFLAWLDYHGRYERPKLKVSAFVARLGARHDSVERFFNDYPDGHLIQIVREPNSWFESVKGKFAGARTVEDVYRRRRNDRSREFWRCAVDSQLAREIYIHAVRTMEENKRRFGSRVTVISYCDLTQDVEGTMRRLSGVLGIPFHPTMTTQTFNSRPISPNTSFPAGRPPRSSILTELEREHMKGALATYDVLRERCL